MKTIFRFSVLLLLFSHGIWAEGEASPDPVAEKLTALQVGLDTLWVLVAGMLVFFMNAGFALVESGFCQSKNTVNILAKNFIVFAASTFSFYAIGWGIMFGTGSNGYFGSEGLFFLQGADNSPAVGDAYQGTYSSMNWTGVPLEAKFFFQLVFAATAATIVSGAVAERIKFHSFTIFSFILVAVLYPITGHWVWGGGWLAELGFHDFAGSTVVHSVGGWAALSGALVLGPRKGKFLANGHIKPILGHSMTSAALGTLILWLGWFGFNPGSFMGVGDGAGIAHVILTTNISAAMGALASTVTAWIIFKKPDLGMILNGTLAGLVGITAPCAIVSTPSAVIIGTVSGILVVLSVLTFDKLKIDDPVGATSVHLVCGIWGTVAVAIFGSADMPAGVDVPSLVTQLTGILAIGVFTFAISFALWFLLKLAGGIRVSDEEEVMGLDLGEHGAEAYPDFNIRAHG